MKNIFLILSIAILNLSLLQASEMQISAEKIAEKIQALSSEPMNKERLAQFARQIAERKERIAQELASVPLPWTNEQVQKYVDQARAIAQEIRDIVKEELGTTVDEQKFEEFVSFISSQIGKRAGGELRMRGETVPTPETTTVETEAVKSAAA